MLVTFLTVTIGVTSLIGRFATRLLIDILSRSGVMDTPNELRQALRDLRNDTFIKPAH